MQKYRAKRLKIYDPSVCRRFAHHTMTRGSCRSGLLEQSKAVFTHHLMHETGKGGLVRLYRWVGVRTLPSRM